VSLPIERPRAGSSATREPQVIERALDRATGSRAIPGNAVHHVADSAAGLELMLERIATARSWVHFENYIIRCDRTGERFAQALIERVRHGVRVRLLYDAFGSFRTPRRYWRALTAAGVDVRPFRPLLSAPPHVAIQRDHRKLVAVDGVEAILGGICIGDEWAGDPAQRRQPWRDTVVHIQGPAASALDRAFAHIWSRAGDPLPDDESAASVPSRGGCSVRVVEGIPGRSRTYRAEQLLAAGAAERLWITDAYLVAPPPLFASLIDAARDGVDVRLLLPGASDVPLARALTRVGYRELLAAGARIFEWAGPMMHAKTMLADRTWARIGSSNLNATSLLGNYELDVLLDSSDMAEEMAAQFRHDLAWSREIVMGQRRRMRLPPRLVEAPRTADAGHSLAEVEHHRTMRERRAAAVVTLRQVAGGARRLVTGVASAGFLLTGAALVLIPTVTSIILAVAAIGLGLGFAWSAVTRRQRDPDRGA
jgi:cardiolipin synthase